MAKIPMNVKIWRGGKCIELNNVICVAKNPFVDMLIINQPKQGFHLHIKGFRKGVITNEQKRDIKEKYTSLTLEDFNKLKDNE